MRLYIRRSAKGVIELNWQKLNRCKQICLCVSSFGIWSANRRECPLVEVRPLDHSVGTRTGDARPRCSALKTRPILSLTVAHGSERSMSYSYFVPECGPSPSMRRPIPVKSFFCCFRDFFPFFPFSQAASVATLPSALLCERFSLGASWVFSIQ